MYWADLEVKKIVDSGKYTPYWVDDMKTPSGFPHIGSLRGPLIHDIVYHALKGAGHKVAFTYIFNDFDPMDELPQMFPELKDEVGKPLRAAKSPVKEFDSLGALFTDDLKKTLESLGLTPKYYSSWDMYREGKFDGVIREALDNAELIQDIYQKVSGSKKREAGWLPFQTICEKCGKVGTTKVFAWDGKEVSYKCEPNLVTWAKGCGHEGKISPFGGTGKLPWKVDWAAHWKVLGITIEGAGKDHASAGGSYDIAMEIVKKVFKYERPFKLPYEFLLIGGRKMSSSKGLGLKSHDAVKILPPEVVRFLFTRTKINEQVEFNPTGSMGIPDIFDEYDRAWRSYDTDTKDHLARAFELSQVRERKTNTKIFLPRFREVANYMQLPNINLKEKFEEEKGSKLTVAEAVVLAERVKYAKIWLETYAPDEFKQSFAATLPEKAKDLSDDQKYYLKKVIHLVEEAKKPEDLQLALYNLSKELNLDAKTAFGAIYTVLIGKDHGPKAGWFLMEFPKEKVIDRINEATK